MSYFPSQEIQVYATYLTGDILKDFTRLACSKPNTRAHRGSSAVSDCIPSALLDLGTNEL